MQIKNSVFLVCVISMYFINAQPITCHKGRLDLGTEIQIYPAGIIPTITTNYFFINNLALRARIGTNIANRRNLSPYNDNETAFGYGGSLGLVTYFPYKKGHFTLGLTTDIWSMQTKWKDGIFTPTPTAGKTFTLVVQPWADAGYLYQIKNTHINLGLTIGFGKEINVITKGERVGEGWMGSATLTLNYIFI